MSWRANVLMKLIDPFQVSKLLESPFASATTIASSRSRLVCVHAPGAPPSAICDRPRACSLRRFHADRAPL